MNTATDDLRESYRKMLEEMERIAKSPLSPATIEAIKGDKMRITSSNGTLVVVKPVGQKVKIGDQILILKETSAYVEHNTLAQAQTMAAVARVMDDGALLVEMNGQTKIVGSIVAAKLGDTVMLDDFGVMALKVLPRDTKTYSVAETGVQWTDIGGNAEAKAALIEAIENPYKFPELYKAYGVAETKGVMLYGPPGCGKTMLGKAAATSIGATDGFIYCKGPEVLNEYVGVAERNVRELFARAREYKARSGRRAVVFIDEAEALLGHRGGRQSFMEKTIVPTFLAEMDGVSDSGAVVILATNHADSLDSAVVRDGRIDRKIKVGRPAHEDAKDILKGYLKKAPLFDCIDAMTEKTSEMVYTGTFMNRGESLPLRQFVSGALLSGVVNKAKGNAMVRDMEVQKVTGIKQIDLDMALATTVRDMAGIALGEAA